jgi:hypothetical protein
MKQIYITLLILMISTFSASPQSANIPLNSTSEALLQRYEIRAGLLLNTLYSDLKPYTRSEAAMLIIQLDTLITDKSRSDLFNFSYLQSDNLSYSRSPINDSRKAILRQFYKSKANMIQVKVPDFELYVNPALHLAAGSISDADKPLYTNTRAIEIRGNIAGKIGFYSFISENQMRIAPHEMAFRSLWGSFPGAHLTKSFKNGGIDFLQARGYFTFSPVKPIRIQFGQDRNFIGNGIRSLLLSDFATDYLFLRINTKVWRFNYQNLFMRLTDRYGYVAGNADKRPYPAKYAAIHYLSINLLKNLNIGFFESVTFHDNNNDGRSFDINYLNPIIFYRAIEHQQGDADKMMVGLNLNYLPFKGVQLYGQLAFNEFRINDLRAGNGHAANKFAYQTGIYWVDALNLPNLDLRVEYNRIRPYMYAHYTHQYDQWPVNSYSHYNQALAHPIGANLSELLVRILLQPWPRFTAQLNLIYTDYGADSAGSNWGNNIFLDYQDYEQELDNSVGQGVSTQLLIASALLTYQLRHNLFIDLDLRYRDLQSDIATRNSNYLYIGTALRLNLPHRPWNF